MRYYGRIDLRLCSIVILIAAMVAGAFAQGRGAGSAPNNFYRFNYTLEEMQPIDYPAQPIVTKHQITLQKETIQYTANVGFIPIRNATTRAAEGHLFYVYYAKDGVTDRSKRPVWFLFNGGPGAATIWLHMGAFGPKVVKLNPDGLAPPPPYSYVDNPYCLLDTGDLVFIDAMGTGFSRPDKPTWGPNFGGVQNDLAAFGEFIRSFLNEYNLWGSPIFVGGESYGTTRAAGLAGYLTDMGIPPNGVMLLSAVIDSNAGAGIQRQLSTLPTEIMTAHYHKKLAPELQKLTVVQIAEQARQFASGEYLEFLFDGARASQAQRDRVLTNFARLTGLSKAFVDANDLLVPLGPFSTELHARPAPDDVAPGFAFRRLPDRRRQHQHELRFQQRQHLELLPHLFRGLRPQRPELQEPVSILCLRQRASLVGRIQHRDQPGERIRQEPAHAPVRGIRVLRFRLSLLPGGVDDCPHEGVRRGQEEQHFARLLRVGPHGLHRPAGRGQISRRPGQVRPERTAEMMSSHSFGPGLPVAKRHR